MSVEYKFGCYDVYQNKNCKPRLHVRHLYFAGKTLLSDVTGIVRPECCMRVARGRFCNKIAGTVLQNIPGYKCNRLQLLSQNSFEDDDLPVQVKKAHVCSHGFRQELHTFQPNTFQGMFLDTRVEERTFEMSNYGFLRQ